MDCATGTSRCNLKVEKYRHSTTCLQPAQQRVIACRCVPVQCGVYSAFDAKHLCDVRVLAWAQSMCTAFSSNEHYNAGSSASYKITNLPQCRNTGAA